MVTRRAEPRSTTGPYVAAVGVTVVGVAPSFLAAALATELRSDIGLSLTGLGALVAVFNLAAATSSSWAGRLVTRGGARIAARWAILGMSAVMAASALAGTTWQLLVLFAIGGAVSSLTQPAANLLLTHRVGANRRAFAFGIKQAAVPLASMCAGLAVPLIVVAVGWRWTFVAGAVIAACLLRLLDAFDLAGVTPVVRDRRRRQRVRRGVVVLVVPAILAGGGVASMSTFLVTTAHGRGLGLPEAGLLLALASLSSIVVRVVGGWRADRRDRRHLLVIAQMMAIGGVATIPLNYGPLWLLWPAAVIAFGLGWGWNGLLHFAMVHYNPEAPVHAASVIQSGLYLGAAAGPFTFGLVAEATSLSVAWMGVGGCMCLAALMVLVGRQVLKRELQSGAPQDRRDAS